MSPSVSVLTGFDCLDCKDLAGGGGEEGVSSHNSRALSLLASFLRAWFKWWEYCPVYSFSARPGLNSFFKKHIGKDHLNRSVNMQNKEDDQLRN